MLHSDVVRDVTGCDFYIFQLRRRTEEEAMEVAAVDMEAAVEDMAAVVMEEVVDTEAAVEDMEVAATAVVTMAVVAIQVEK